MMRYVFSAMVVLALAACQPKVPDSGVGFDGYSEYAKKRAARDAQLEGNQIGRGGVVSDEISQAGTQRVKQTHTSTAAISDEQDFNAVSGRETIESDKERLARQRAQYVVIEPTAVPTGSNAQGAALVKYALSTRNKRGQAIYKRSNAGMSAQRYRRNCAKYPSPDRAQTAFLNSGGPARDSKGLDPDGDGFACEWDPQPFRNARKAASIRAVPPENG
ncbi:MAG: hypothetical protein CSA68_09240 [Rhodobacterales bacterium]|nr:MAG: hypothetical protein CSA68_09240 [Rhodobacterales bacterium]